jgi:hypothetical protein
VMKAARSPLVEGARRIASETGTGEKPPKGSQLATTSTKALAAGRYLTMMHVDARRDRLPLRS